MGGYTSKDFEEMVEEMPPTPPAHKRILDFDPRSPTVGIARTPISVEKTPNLFLDPRSPTSGIARTPIYKSMPPTAVTGDTPILKISTETENPALPEDWLNTDNIEEPPSGQVGELLNRSLSEPDLQKLDENGQLKEAAQPERKTLSSKKPAVVKVKKAVKPKSLFPAEGPPQNRKIVILKDADLGRSPLKAKDNSSRSPLSSLDHDSPRIAVQKKQIAKLGLTKRNIGNNSPVRYEVLHDKENVCL